jgi:hypothetical protein
MGLNLDEIVLNVDRSYTYKQGEVTDVSYFIRDLDTDMVVCQDIIDPISGEASEEMATLMANAIVMYKALSEISRIYQYDNSLPWIERSLRMWAVAKTALIECTVAEEGPQA